MLSHHDLNTNRKQQKTYHFCPLNSHCSQHSSQSHHSQDSLNRGHHTRQLEDFAHLSHALTKDSYMAVPREGCDIFREKCTRRHSGAPTKCIKGRHHVCSGGNTVHFEPKERSRRSMCASQIHSGGRQMMSSESSWEASHAYSNEHGKYGCVFVLILG